MNIQQFIHDNNLKMTCKRASFNPYMPDMKRNFTCTIKNTNTLESMVVPFSQGEAWKTDPTLEDVLECLAMDTSMVRYSCPTFDDYMNEFGYDSEDPEVVRQHRKSFRATVNQADSLERLLGTEALETLIEIEF